MYKVLLVDDEPAVLEGLKSAVNWDEYGLEVLGLSSNGIQALDMIHRTKINILLTDIRMPEKNGIELIKCIREEGSNIKVVILSGYDDFDYIKQAVKLGVENYLLKPLNKEELASTLQTTVEKLDRDLYDSIQSKEKFNVFKENILYRWVSNTIDNREFQERAPIINVDCRKKEYQVALVKILEVSALKEIGLAGFSVWNICSEIMSGIQGTLVFRDLANDIVLLFSGDDLVREKTQIHMQLKECIRKIKDYLKINTFITVGRIESGYQNVHESYYSAKDLQAYSLILPSDTLADFDRIKKISDQHKEHFEIDFKEFTNNIILKKQDEVSSYIENVMNKLVSTDGITPVTVKSIVFEILYNLLNTVKKAVKNVDDMPVELKGSFMFVDSFRTHGDMIEWLKSVTRKAIEYMNSKDKKMCPLIKQILNHIHTYYNMEISLKSLSYMFNTNASYVGRLFKIETGEMFTDYLNNIRIEKAQEMLESDSFKVNEISEKVGYANKSHFFRVFKKITGVSPIEYKENIIYINKSH